jgi:outer membrane protein TolC
MRRHLRALALLLCFALTGCHSLPLASLISLPAGVPALAGSRLPSPPEGGTPTVRLGDPIIQSTIARAQAPDGELPLPTIVPSASQVIDLTTALTRAGVDNPTIALAEEAVRVSLAERMFARSLLFPTLDAGANVRVHRGNLQNSSGAIFEVNTQSLDGGFGTDAKGGGTTLVPGIRLVAHLADAVYAPKAAQQRVAQSRFDAAATRNSILLEVGARYLALAEGQAALAAYQQSLAEFGEIERITTEFAKAKQGQQGDAQRARSERLLLLADARRSEEAIGVAAAELARLLDLDPSQPLRSADLVPPLVELVDKKIDVHDLLAMAMANHPEIGARSAAVAFQEIRVKQERVRPFLPLVAVGFSAGEFGGGGPTTTSRLGNFGSRTDIDVVAVWSLQNAGVGNRAVQNVTRSEWEQAQLERARTIDRIRREIVEAHTLVTARRQEIELARSRVETSQRAYRLELTRTKNILGQPIELLHSANQLAVSRQDLVRAMIGYSTAQLQLYAALGNAP